MKVNNTLLIINTETGGIDPNRDSLMQLGCIVLKDFQNIHEYSTLVKSPYGKYVCNYFARKLHGIKDEDIEKYGKLPSEIIQDLKDIQTTYFNNEPMTIVAHNSAFDISFLKKMFTDNNQTLNSEVTKDEFDYNNMFSRNAIDTATMALILRLQGKLPFDRCSLNNIVKHYNIDNKIVDNDMSLTIARQTADAFLCMFEDLKTYTKQVKFTEDEFESDFDDSKNFV